MIRTTCLQFFGSTAMARPPMSPTSTNGTRRANLVRFDRKTGKRTKVLTGFASLPNGLVEGPDGALYTSNWGVSFASGDGEVLRIVL